MDDRVKALILDYLGCECQHDRGELVTICKTHDLLWEIEALDG